jgi:hypothetical protein
MCITNILQKRFSNFITVSIALLFLFDTRTITFFINCLCLPGCIVKVLFINGAEGMDTYYIFEYYYTANTGAFITINMQSCYGEKTIRLSAKIRRNRQRFRILYIRTWNYAGNDEEKRAILFYNKKSV